MALPVVTVASGGLPVMDVAQLLPLPPGIAARALPVTEAVNGRGTPVTKVANGKPGLAVTYVAAVP